MSPHLYFRAFVQFRSTNLRAVLFLLMALGLGLIVANSAAWAQSDLPSTGWQAAPVRSAPSATPMRTSEAAAPQQNGWQARPIAKSDSWSAAPQDSAPVSLQPAAPITADSAFGDAPQRKTTRSLVWQQQSAPPSGARRYPAATRPDAAQPSQHKVSRGVVQAAYEFEDPPAGNPRAANTAEVNAEPIATPEPINAPKPLPAHQSAPVHQSAPAPQGVIEDDSSEIVEGGEGEEGGELLGDSCGCCDNCGHCNCLCCCRPFANKLWVRSEYLLWWSPGYNLPALVTTSTSTNFATAGRLGDPSTTVLFGNSQFGDKNRSGLRIGAGYLLMPCRDISIEGYYTTTGTLSTDFTANSSTFPVLARPFTNVMSNVQGQSAHLIAFPDEATGSISINLTSEFNSAEMLIRRKMCDEHNYHIDFFGGFRYARLAENLQILESQNVLEQRMPFPQGTSLLIGDHFNALNEFNGGEFGFSFSEQYNRWTLDVTAKLAVGNTNSQVAIGGSTTRMGVAGVSNATLIYPGGVLAQTSNSGLFETNSITVMPELGVKLGFFLNRRLKLSAGYNFIYWSKVYRPGDQIDTNINSSQIPPNTLGGAAFPQYPNKTTDFWLQGFTAGLEYRF